MSLLLVSDPGAAYRAQKDALDAAVARVLASGWYILGSEVEAFERDYAAWQGGGDFVSCANGTDALELALRALGLRPGDEVLTVSHTAVATVVAIERAGLRPVLADVDANGVLDPARAGAVLESQRGGIRAIVAVHLYGRPCDMDALAELARRYGVKLVEDCAQAHGARWRGRKVGGFGDAAAFSFYPTKNLGALGDGGGTLFRDPADAARARELRQYGWRERYLSAVPGFNSRLDELQAAVLRVKLGALDAGNARRREIAGLYAAALPEALVLTRPDPAVEHVFHQFVLRTPRRDALAAALKEAGIASAVLYPRPVHLQEAYRGRLRLDSAGLPVSEALAGEVLSLPMHPQLSDADAVRVRGAVLAWSR